jgi:hypothetical protein
MRTLSFLIATLVSASLYASDALVQLETRTGVNVPVYYMKRDGAVATVVLLSGGSGGFGQLIDGKPSSENFLVRTRDYFADSGLNVAVMGRVSDKNELDYVDRIAPEHMEDIKYLVDYLKKDASLPVWLIGTSRGTISATAAAIAFGNDNLAGIVLTASVVSYKKIGAVPKQDLAVIRTPVLVLHHEKDSCKICDPSDVPAIIKGLKNAPVKKLIMVRGGENPTGDPCKALHYHGFIGMEKAAVGLMTDWIKHPTP